MVNNKSNYKHSTIIYGNLNNKVEKGWTTVTADQTCFIFGDFAEMYIKAGLIFGINQRGRSIIGKFEKKRKERKEKKKQDMAKVNKIIEVSFIVFFESLY